MTSPSTFASANNTSNFQDFGLHDLLLKGVEAAGFTTPSDIQTKVIPIILAGKDLVAQAQTGTGKTAAFGLATLHMIDPSKKGAILVLTPTRELAVQVAAELKRLGKYLGIDAVPIYGGTSGPRQIEQLNRGAQVIVATPGRLLDHLESNRIKNFSPSIVVLDEADQMVDMGFIDDLKKILKFLPKERQTLLFSATMPEAILKFCNSFLKDPSYVDISKKLETNENIEHWYHLVEHHKKLDVLSRLIDFYNPHKALIFCKTKKDVEQVRETLTRLRSEFVHALHGDMEQRQRERVVEDFKNGKITILVATDIAARGLNILDISHVFNYHPPFDKENYVHRIGRTARAGKHGIAISLVSNSEKRSFDFVQKSLGEKITYKPLPSQAEQKELALTKLSEELASTQVTDEIKNILSQFEDVEHFKEKLLVLLLKNRGFFKTENFKNFALDERSGSSDRFDKPRFDRSDRGRSDRGRPGRGNFDRDRSDKGRFQRSDRGRFEGSERPQFDKPRFARSERSEGSDWEKPKFDRPRSDKPRFDRPDRHEGSDSRDKPKFDGPKFDRPRSDKPRFDKPKVERSDKPEDSAGRDRPRFDKPRFEKSDKFEGSAGRGKPKFESSDREGRSQDFRPRKRPALKKDFQKVKKKKNFGPRETSS